MPGLTVPDDPAPSGRTTTVVDGCVRVVVGKYGFAYPDRIR
jgi:hypothetical protein